VHFFTYTEWELNTLQDKKVSDVERAEITLKFKNLKILFFFGLELTPDYTSTAIKKYNIKVTNTSYKPLWLDWYFNNCSALFSLI